MRTLLHFSDRGAGFKGLHGCRVSIRTLSPMVQSDSANACRNASTPRLGISSCKISKRLAARSLFRSDRPVMLLPGRAKLATMPAPTGVPRYWKDDRNDGGGLLGGKSWLGSGRENDIDLEPDELGRNLGEAFGASFRPTIFNSGVAALDPAELAQALHKSDDQRSLRRCCTGTKEADGPRWAAARAPRVAMPRKLAPQSFRVEDETLPGAGEEVHFGEYPGVPGCRLSRAQAFRC